MKGLWKSKLDFIDGGKHSYSQRRKKTTKKQFIKDNLPFYFKGKTQREPSFSFFSNRFMVVVSFYCDVKDGVETYKRVYKTKRFEYRRDLEDINELRKSIYTYVKYFFDAVDIEILSLYKENREFVRKFKGKRDYIPNFDFDGVLTIKERKLKERNMKKSFKYFKSSLNRMRRRKFNQALYKTEFVDSRFTVKLDELRKKIRKIRHCGCCRL